MDSIIVREGETWVVKKFTGVFKYEGKESVESFLSEGLGFSEGVVLFQEGDKEKITLRVNDTSEKLRVHFGWSKTTWENDVFTFEGDLGGDLLTGARAKLNHFYLETKEFLE